MKMFNRKPFIVLLSVIVLGIGGAGLFFYTSKQPMKAETTNEEQEKKDVDEENKSEASGGLENLSDEEILELFDKFEKANKGGEKLNEEEAELLRAIPPEKAYDLMGMTDDEVLGYINGFHQHIDTLIMLYHEGSEDFNEEFLTGKPEFEWMKENYNFEKEEHYEAINEILDLIDKYPENNKDVLFSLKPILWELNEELNPESLKEERANKLSLEDAERIQNGQDPKDR